jgi:hypothetical protein
MLRIVLLAGGAMMALAILAVPLPASWMEAIHRAGGLGELPDAPIVDYLARTTSWMYAMLGGLCLLLATDPRRYAPIITYVACVLIFAAVLVTVLGLMYLAGGSRLGAWLVIDAVTAAPFGAAILILQRLASREER